ncbi:MAG: putative toxin, partial [Beijerinckiaceae bacterium]
WCGENCTVINYFTSSQAGLRVGLGEALRLCGAACDPGAYYSVRSGVVGFDLSSTAAGEAFSALRLYGVADELASGTTLAQQLGQAGEEAAGIIANTQRIPSLTGTAAYRIPDVLNESSQIIGEVKNVGYLSYTSQLRDFILFAQQNGFQFQLTVRPSPSTTLSGPLQNEIASGNITLRNLPGP